MECPMLRHLATVGLLAWSASIAGASEVKGRVVMPDSCSPTVSPAVVTLESLDARSSAVLPNDESASAVALTVRQQGLQFEPRVQVAHVGQAIKFTNQDGEPHNVHSATPGVSFSWSMAPNATEIFTPDAPGLIRLVCDVHSHMRGYVVVSASPWAKVCRSGGMFSFKGVPEGRYTLSAWHEMGQPYRAEVIVAGESTDLGPITLQSSVPTATAKASAPVVAWPEVVDRISVLLSEAQAVVKKPNGLAKARKLAEDAYWGEFELSDMETAVRRHLGYGRAGAIEAQLRGFRTSLKTVSEGRVEASELRGKLGKLMIELSRASEDLKRLNVFDRRDIGKVAEVVEAAEVIGRTEQAKQLDALAASLVQVRNLADAGKSDEALSAMTDAYFNDFEPIERMLQLRAHQAVTPLERQFNAIRGLIDSGVGGSRLEADMDQLRVAIVRSVSEANSAVAGSFAPAFGLSLVTILREGVEVILLLTMLITLASKAGQPRAMTAIYWGIGGAVLASAATAYGLNLLVASSQGRTREVIEGAVMMVAASILFSVSYWLISQTQAKRWSDFLKSQIANGAKVGGLGTLAATAFLAVYREGAETTLMYQAMISGQGGSREGLIGVFAGLGLGTVLLAIIAVVIRASSVRLPMRSFFKATGFLLFAMAVIFAGNGVFELQNAGLVKVTPVTWVGLGVPALGFHPNVQAMVIQGFLLLGALMTLVVPLFERRAIVAPIKPSPAGVGAGV